MDLYDIENYCHYNGIKNFTVQPNGVIDVAGSVVFKIIDECLPDGIQFGHVSGSFNCTWCTFYSLRGFPLSLGGEFESWFAFVQPSQENFEVLYRYDYDNLSLRKSFKVEYDKYYKARKRVEAINEILK